MNVSYLKNVFFVVCFISWGSSFLPIQVSIRIFYAKTDFSDLSFLTGESWIPRNCSRFLQNDTDQVDIVEDGTSSDDEELNDEIAEKVIIEKCLENLHITKGDKVLLTTLIIVGGVILLSSVIGICGGIHKSRNILSVNLFLHGVSIFVILCATFGLLYDILSKYNDANLKFKSSKRLHDLLRQQYSSPSSEVNLIKKYYSSSLDLFQKQNNCCGIFGPQDYFLLNQTLSENNSIQCNCCHINQGCWHAIESSRRHNNWIVFSMLFSCCLILIIGVIVGFLLNQYLQEFPT